MWIPVESALMSTPQISPKVNSGEVVSVSWLNRAAREALEGSFPLLWITGEVSTLTRAASGHLYFTLKDEQAQVRCTMWRNRAQLLGFRLEHGMRVEVRALVTLFEPRGDYQLNIEAVRQAGVGNLYEAFLRLKTRLERGRPVRPSHQARPAPLSSRHCRRHVPPSRGLARRDRSTRTPGDAHSTQPVPNPCPGCRTPPRR